MLILSSASYQYYEKYKYFRKKNSECLFYTAKSSS